MQFQCSGNVLEGEPGNRSTLLIHRSRIGLEEVTEDWERANVPPAFTKGKKENLGNYRLISINQIPKTGLIPGPTLFKIFSNDLANRTEYNLSKFADRAKLGRVADTPDGCGAIQRDLNRLKKWPTEIL
ncbi:rna-directed dna polymerase from mobile element jockey-like [Limosa lapponica baueri]|uniref:Rna-directed dna polymerase from mobile element jockey-like n=1 Tax=Limosa lapponica baueri TaxID=1758121 RepID=A0A2I0USB1_LIMLA|nr:rna-directed dna polymerase from mobile element jockey-like [Limosa lapponica baueri]